MCTLFFNAFFIHFHFFFLKHKKHCEIVKFRNCEVNKNWITDYQFRWSFYSDTQKNTENTWNKAYETPTMRHNKMLKIAENLVKMRRKTVSGKLSTKKNCWNYFLFILVFAACERFNRTWSVFSSQIPRRVEMIPIFPTAILQIDWDSRVIRGRADGFCQFLQLSWMAKGFVDVRGEGDRISRLNFSKKVYGQR